MSRQAQAEREKQARVILGSAEAAIAGKFVEAAMTYADHPTALQLRAMNIIYETTKERGATILIPTSMVDSMNPVVALALAGRKPHRKRRMGLRLLTPGKRVSRHLAPPTNDNHRRECKASSKIATAEVHCSYQNSASCAFVATRASRMHSWWFGGEPSRRSW